MPIKWENIKILNSPLTNNIYLGKLDKTGRLAIDKSSSRTMEALAAVMTYLDGVVANDKTSISVVNVPVPAGRLTWQRNTKTINNLRVIEELLLYPDKEFFMVNYEELERKHPTQIDSPVIINSYGKICYDTEGLPPVRLTECFLSECKWEEYKRNKEVNEHED